MKVLVSAASKHGATTEIAEEIGGVLREALHAHKDDGEEERDVQVLSPELVGSVEPYDAVVLGSAVYGGHWLEPARELAKDHEEALAERPTWLFSVGPIGDPPKPEEDPVDVAPVLEATKARDHRIFTGKLDRGTLGFAEKAIVLALRAPEGDFRDWEDIREWAQGIAAELQDLGTSGTT
jgi:menaquinone-dependent protoporphyrinogen oxidase